MSFGNSPEFERMQLREARKEKLKKYLENALWILGLPMRIAFGIIFLVIVAMLAPKHVKSVARDAWEGVKGNA